MTRRHLLGYLLSITPAAVSRAMRQLLRGRYLTVLCYHRILDTGEDFPFDSDLVSASTDQFRSQLRYISRNYNVINFKSLLDHLREKDGRFPPKPLIITFDDGYIDNYTVAYPILREFNLTATMFVTAGFMGEKRIFWWDRIAYIIKKTDKNSIEIKSPVEISVDISRFGDRQDCARKLIKRVKEITDSEKEEVIEKLSDQLGVTPPEGDTGYTMSWEQLREMNSEGIEIGAHSVNHPIFSNVDGERLRREVGESRKIIENNIENRVITFGSPGRGIMERGERERFTRTLRNEIKDSGYHFSTLYRWGLVYENSLDRFGIERIGVETHDTGAVFRAKLMFPEIITY
ncbi:MAG: polysaccharide deacetylase family protein [Candidatus Latescibacteria bacterium]|nr:polysaccharide deacetylase family protein [bacterium]MBD3423375.1 polysaccharide deacetylase family protein [Candidatus Latescibacterota bacterium]